MKLIYQEIYEIIDKSMSDSQIGSRKGKNIRNHVWILNSILSDVLNTKKKKSVDIQIYDYKQCFDGLWLEECLNDMYTGGLKDNKLNLLYNANSIVNIVVKTAVGKTKQSSIQNCVIQGDVFAPLLCSKQIDQFGKECLEASKYTYLYKGEVEIPPLAMVDDILAISECGFKSTMINAFLNCKTSSKKLQFGAQKCRKMHIGKQREEFKCHPIYVESWKEEDFENANDENVVQDISIGKVEMKDTEEEKYLGDVISSDGKNSKNIKARVNKGKGIVKKILDILENMPFGKLYFQVAILLRNSLLVSSMLCNSETWFNLTKADLELLESVDLMLLRKILGTPISTPKEMLYLELGLIPFREIIRQRRLNFLHYLLAQDENTIISKVFQKQKQEGHKKDWVARIKMDLDELRLDITFEEIQKTSKMVWRNTIRKYIEENAFRNLEIMKQTHSKVKELKHIRLKIQDYFLPNGIKNITKQDIQLIFQMRSQVTNLKQNMKGKYETFECRACLVENESQTHVYECKEIWKKRNISNIENPCYENIIWGNVIQKIKVARIFHENLKILETIREKTCSLTVPGDRLLSSLQYCLDTDWKYI